MKTVIIVCASMLLAGGVAAAPPVEVSQAVEVDGDITVYKLGGVELPYDGEGGVEYWAIESENLKVWIIDFEAPEGFRCTHIGYMFDATGDIPIALADGAETWAVSGLMDMQVVEDMLYVSVWAEDGLHEFWFLYDDALADDTETFVQDESGVLQQVKQVQQVQQVQQEEQRQEEPQGRGPQEAGAYYALGIKNCPGGSCVCFNKCQACCKADWHPDCICAGTGRCRCLKDEVNDSSAQMQIIAHEFTRY